MKRHGQIIGIDPDVIDEYINYHENIWPDVAEKIKECNIRNYSIYLFDDKLFSYFEYTGDDYEADMAKMGKDPATREWWKIMGPMQRPVSGRKEGEWWAEMREVFHQE